MVRRACGAAVRTSIGRERGPSRIKEKEKEGKGAQWTEL